MARAAKPSDWKRIERAIKLRAEFRCECGTFWDCEGGNHFRRCGHTEGQRYPHNKRLIKLRVTQIGAADDWRPNALVALCLPCYRLVPAVIRAQDERDRSTAARHTKDLEAQMDSMFTIDIKEGMPYEFREQN